MYMVCDYVYVYYLSRIKINLNLNYETAFQLILRAGHCFDLAVKQITMA